MAGRRTVVVVLAARDREEKRGERIGFGPKERNEHQRASLEQIVVWLAGEQNGGALEGEANN